MRRWSMSGLALAALVLPGCAVHHVHDPWDDTVTRSYYDWEPDSWYWGAHFHEYEE
jgi:hypothetical protein